MSTPLCRFAIVAVDPDTMQALGPVYESDGRPMGAGTVGLEIAEQWPEVEAALFPVGGGGLIAGIAALGPGIGALDFVSHCYRRPSYPDWPYNIIPIPSELVDDARGVVHHLRDRLSGRET